MVLLGFWFIEIPTLLIFIPILISTGNYKKLTCKTDNEMGFHFRDMFCTWQNTNNIHWGDVHSLTAHQNDLK